MNLEKLNYVIINGKNIKNFSEKKTNSIELNTIPNEEELKHEKVTFELGKIIARERNLKKITQKEFAIKINENFHIINDYESGKAIPNKNILLKMEKILEIKLIGKDIGSRIKKK